MDNFVFLHENGYPEGTGDVYLQLGTKITYINNKKTG